MTPKTTVITLSYNRPDYLAEAIISIENQTHQNYEHLVYDNGSTDPGVREVLRAAKRRHPDKFFYSASGAPGIDLVGVHWNVMLGFARGEYITILDDDNRKRPDFLDKMSAPLDFNADVEAVSCGWMPILMPGVQPAKWTPHLNLRTSMAALFQDNTIDSNALLFRKRVLDKIGHFDPTLTTNEDWHFIIRLVRACKVVHLNHVLLDYRLHQAARSRRAMALGAHENWDRIRRELFTEEEMVMAHLGLEG